MNPYFFALILISALLFSCGQSEPETSYTETEDQAIADTNTIADEASNERLTPLQLELREFDVRKQEVADKLLQMNKEQANDAYDRFRKAQDKAIERISSMLAKILENYYVDGAGKNGEDKALAAVGLEFWEVGEGITEIRTEAHYYEQIFAPYLTPDYKLYVQLEAKDAEKLYQADAGLVIPMEEVGQRAIRWENFMLKYPKSKKYKEALSITRMYQMDFLFGLDNTPTHDFEPLQLTEEAGLKMEELARKYPSSNMAALSRYMFINLEGKEFEEKIELVREMQDKLVGK